MILSGCDKAREDAFRFRAMMPSKVIQQAHLHAGLVSGFTRIPNGLRHMLSLQR
jgi:hypothetical protein